MPTRSQDRKPTKKVTLGETLNWIAHDDFNGPPLSSHEIESLLVGEGFDLEASEIAGNLRALSLEDAEKDLFAALRDGDVQSYGRFSDQLVDKAVPQVWSERTYTDHSSDRIEIPADFWRLEGVNWESSQAKSSTHEFNDIILFREKVLAIWEIEEAEDEEGEEPNSSGEQIKENLHSGRGRKPLYSQTSFLRLCVWEASLNGLPDKKSEFLDRMSRLLDIIWSENKSPGDTWLKARISAIYKLKNTYENGRQELEGG